MNVDLDKPKDNDNTLQTVFKNDLYFIKETFYSTLYILNVVGFSFGMCHFSKPIK